MDRRLPRTSLVDLARLPRLFIMRALLVTVTESDRPTLHLSNAAWIDHTRVAVHHLLSVLGVSKL